MSKQPLTAMQEAFLEALFDPENKGNYKKAARIAGYSDTVSTYQILQSVKEHILDRVKQLLAHSTPKAALSMVGILDDPSAFGNRELLNAAKEILDRAGITKPDGLDIIKNSQGAVFILPAKQVNKDAD